MFQDNMPAEMWEQAEECHKKDAMRHYLGILRERGFCILDLEKDVHEVTIKTQGKVFCLSCEQLRKLVLENCEPTNKKGK